MAKKKDSVALFEVINKGRQQRDHSGISVPAWMGPKKQEAEGEYRSSDGGASDVTGPPPLPAARRFGGEPAVSIEPGRIHLSLTYITGAMILGAFVVLMIGVFWLGRATAPTPTATADMGQPPLNPEVLGLERHQSGVPGGQTPPVHTPGRIAGKYYLIIQHTDGKTAQHETDAKSIAGFCRENGYPAEARQTTNGKWLVLSYKEFDSDRSEDALVFAEKIEQLGRKYMAAGGKYNFKQSDQSGASKAYYYRWK